MSIQLELARTRNPEGANYSDKPSEKQDSILRQIESAIEELEPIVSNSL